MAAALISNPSCRHCGGARCGVYSEGAHNRAPQSGAQAHAPAHPAAHRCSLLLRLSRYSGRRLPRGRDSATRPPCPSPRPRLWRRPDSKLFGVAGQSAVNLVFIVGWRGKHRMKALFLGHFAATVAPRILAKVTTPLETLILDDEGDAAHLAPLLANAEIVVGHIWRPSFPPAPRLRLLQSVAAGLDLLDTAAVPKGVTICNVFGHEPAIAEYVIMAMLVLTHRLFEAVTAFRAGSWIASPHFGGGPPHGEVLGRTIGIVGYGRIGREVAERAT